VKTAIRKYLSGVYLGLTLLCTRLAGAYTVPPTAPTWSANGSYSVSWTNQCTNNCASQWLEEKTAAGGFAAVGGGPPKTYVGKPAGQYTYRLARLMRVYAYYLIEYSAEVTVNVTPTAPTVDPLLIQRSYQYQTRVGDIDYDGRRDLFIQRVAGGVANNGVLDNVIVQQTSTPGQYLLVPPSPAQAATAATWPVSSAQVAVEDINVDGFVDVTVKGVANALGVAGARNLIVYSPGQVFNKVPKGIRVVDDGLLKFVGNMLDYQVDPNYFDNYASYTYFYVGSYWSTCGGGPVISNDPILSGDTPGCVWVYQFISGYFPDYSVFSSAAVAIALAAENADTGQTSTTAAVDAIDRAAEDVFKIQIGGWNMEEVLGSTGEHTNPDARRAMEVFWSILGIGRASADEVRTDKAPSQVPRVPGTLYVTKRALGTPWTLHVALEYTSPASIFRSISAYDSDDRTTVDGRLISEKNWFKDAPPLMMTVSEVQRPPTYGDNDAYWFRLLAADTAFVDGSLPYDLVPSIGRGGYNCASYAHGILNATGGIALRVPASGNWTNMWGWGVPVPPSAFN
jgi:hypothetical protein